MAQRTPAAIQATAAQLVAQGMDAETAGKLAAAFCTGQLPHSALIRSMLCKCAPAGCKAACRR